MATALVFWQWAGDYPPLYQLFLILSLVWLFTSTGLSMTGWIDTFRGRRSQEDVALLEVEVEALEIKLEAFEGLQPHLIVEPFVTPHPLRQPTQKKFDPLFNSPPFLAFLRVTNKPKNLNCLAAALQLSAKVFYYDEHGNNLFPTIQETWIIFSKPYDTYQEVVAQTGHTTGLLPQDSGYLGIALKYPRPESPFYFALDKYSGDFFNWTNPQFQLSGETTYIKVLISCDRFRAEHHYCLKDLGPEKGLQLTPISGPTP